MKKIFFLMSLAAAAGFSACTSDTTVDPTITAHGRHTLTACVAAGETRTQLGEKGETTTPVLWSENDAIFVTDPAGNPYKYILEAASAGKKEGTFRVTEGDGAQGAASITAFYPYDNLAYTSGADIKMTIPSAQTYAADRTFATNLNPMYAVSDNADALQFHHMAGVINLQLTSLGADDTGRKVTTIELESAEHQLAGTFTVGNTDGVYSLVPTGTADHNKITLDCGEGVELTQTPSCFLFVIPSGLYTGRDLKFNITIAGDAAKAGTKTLTVTNPLTIAEGQIVNFNAAAMPNVVVVAAETPAEVENSITEALQNETIDENTTLHVKVANLGSGDTTPEITLPSSFDSPAKQAVPVTIELPEADDAVSTVTLKAAATNAPQQVTIVNTASDDSKQAFTIEMPASTVTLTGSYNAVTATTADHTLIVEKGSSIKTLTVAKGSAEIYGLAETIVKDAEAGTVTRFISTSAGLAQAAAVNDPADFLFFTASTEPVDGKDAVLTKPATITGNTQINNLTLQPAKTSENSYVLTVGLPDSDVTEALLDNVTILPTAEMNRGLVIADYPQSLKVTVKNSYIAVPDASNVRPINIYNDKFNGKHTCELSLDNVHIGPTQTATGDKDYTGDQNAAFKKRVDTRGINVATPNVTIDMTDSQIEGVFYAVNTYGGNNLKMNIDNSTLDGRCAFNLWGSESEIRIDNSTLIGRNPFQGSTEVFATIVYCKDTKDEATANKVTVADSKIISYNAPQTATNLQFSADLRGGGNTLLLEGSTQLIERGTADYPARLNYMVLPGDKSNTVTIDPGVTVDGKQDALVVPMTVWDGKRVTAPMPDADTDYPIYGADELAWVAQQINTGNDLRVDHATAHYPAAHYSQVYLQSDLDLANHPWQPIGSNDTHSITVSSAADVPAFRGEFLGSGYTIRNLSVNKRADAKGLFGRVGDGGKLDGVILENVAIPSPNAADADKAGKWVGGLAGTIDNNVTVEACSVKNVSIEAPGMYRIGGLIGFWNNVGTKTTGKLSDCTVETASLTAGYGIGGLIGTIQAPSKTIDQCKVNGITIHHKEQYDWKTDKTYSNYAKETGGYVFASSALVGDACAFTMTGITVGTWSIYDDDRFADCDYTKANWTYLPYVGEMSPSTTLDGTSLTKDNAPKNALGTQYTGTANRK